MKKLAAKSEKQNQHTKFILLCKSKKLATMFYKKILFTP